MVTLLEKYTMCIEQKHYHLLCYQEEGSCDISENDTLYKNHTNLKREKAVIKACIENDALSK